MRIYKFRSIEDLKDHPDSIEKFLKGEFWFWKWKKSEDIKKGRNTDLDEGKFWYYNDKISEAQIKNLVGMKGKMMILCASSKLENEEMWTRYASDYAGVCFEIEFSERDDLVGSEVIYLDKFRLNDDEKQNDRKTVENILFHKREKYEKENEFRLLYESVDNEKEEHGNYIKVGDVSSIYFGKKISEDLKHTLLKSIETDKFKGNKYEHIDGEWKQI